MSAPNQKHVPKKKIRCLVIQMARLGDTLQSLMALRAAQQLYPDLEISMLVRKRFAAATEKIPWIENVYTLDTESLLTPILKGECTVKESLGEVARWIAPVIQEPWDFVVNWTYSQASSFIAALIPANVKLGYTRSQAKDRYCADGWSFYIQGVIQGNVDQNIHLTDIFTTQLLTALQIHVGDPVDPGQSMVTSKGFFKLKLDPEQTANVLNDSAKRWLAIQLGAGQKEKTWDPKDWAKFCSLVIAKHPDCGVIVLGGPEDEEREKIFFDHLKLRGTAQKRIQSLVGKTDFDLWAAVVGKASWALAGDTAIIHLASVLGTRVMNLSLGPVKCAETGPYGNGHYVIAPKAGEELAPETLYTAWAYAHSDWQFGKEESLREHFKKHNLESELSRIKIFKSKIRATQDGGGVVYEPIIETPMLVDEWFSLVMGQIARSWYCGWTPPVGSELARRRVSSQLIKELRELSESVSVLSKLCREASSTAALLSARSKGLKSEVVMKLSDRAELQDLGKKLQEMDALMDRLALVHTPLRAFSQMCKVMMHNLRGSKLADLGQESAEAYRQLDEGATILKDWLKFTIDLVKPTAVPSGEVVRINQETLT